MERMCKYYNTCQNFDDLECLGCSRCELLGDNYKEKTKAKVIYVDFVERERIEEHGKFTS